MNITEGLKSHPLTDLDLSHFTAIDSGTPAGGAIEKMNAENCFCALIHDDDRLTGIFTDRDVLLKVVGQPDRWEGPIDHVMTADPETIGSDSSAIDALRLMNRMRLRNVPVLDPDGGTAGNLTHFCLLGLVDRLLRDDEERHPHNLEAEDGLRFVDFRGLATARPVSVASSTTVGNAIHQMRVRGIGSVLVVDKRRSLVGVITERDVQTRVAGKVEDLDSAPVTDYMTADPLPLDSRDPVANGFRMMAQHRFSHIPLIGPSGRPVGVVSFRDLADYLATTMELDR